ADGCGRAGRRLCAEHLDADLSADGARLVLDQHWRLPDRADPGCPGRVSDRLLPRRLHRAEGHLCLVGCRLVCDGPRVSARANGLPRAVLARHSAEYRPADEVPTDGTLYDRAVPDRDSRHRAGLLLQCRACRRLAVSDDGRVSEPGAVAWYLDCDLQRHRLRTDDRHAAVAGTHGRSLATLGTAAAIDRSLSHAYSRN